MIISHEFYSNITTVFKYFINISVIVIITLMFRLIKAELEAEYIDVLPGENVLGRGPFLKVQL